MRREIYVMVYHQNVQKMFRISVRSRGQENTQLLQSHISLFNYRSPPTLLSVVNPTTTRDMITMHSDGILRLWTFGRGLKSTKAFFEHLYCLSMHPIGH